MLIYDELMFVNHFAHRSYVDTMALRVAGFLKEICILRLMSTEQSKESIQQQQAIATGWSSSATSALSNTARIGCPMNNHSRIATNSNGNRMVLTHVLNEVMK